MIARCIRTAARMAALCMFGMYAVLPVAGAREADGTLGLIQLPNDGVPVIIAPGATFDAVLTEPAAMFLEGGGHQYALEGAWTPLPGNRVKVACTTPDTIPPGGYTIVAATHAKTDRTPRSVYVRESFPEIYSIAHVTDTHIGKDHPYPRRSDDIIRDVLRAVNEAEVAMALITGDLTEGGEEDEFRRFLALLDLCAAPTFVCPGNHDRKNTNYERFFGLHYYMFTFGQDGYLVFDTKDYVTADDLGAQPGALERFRRILKPSRWTVGVTHRYEPSMGMRAQISLFLDNPLDFLVFGHWHRENTEQEKTTPWGHTRMIVTPAAIDGYIRIIDMTARGMLPRPVQQIAETGAAPQREQVMMPENRE